MLQKSCQLSILNKLLFNWNCPKKPINTKPQARPDVFNGAPYCLVLFDTSRRLVHLLNSLRRAVWILTLYIFFFNNFSCVFSKINYRINQWNCLLFLFGENKYDKCFVLILREKISKKEIHCTMSESDQPNGTANGDVPEIELIIKVGMDFFAKINNKSFLARHSVPFMALNFIHSIFIGFAPRIFPQFI